VIPIGHIGNTTARLDLQEVPETGALSEPSPETVIPVGALKEGDRICMSANGVLSAEMVTVTVGA
jgi:hypothetical protein